MSADATETDEEIAGYVHRPGDGGDVAGTSPDESTDAGATDAPGEFGTRGWGLVGIVILSTLVIPGIIYLYPAAPANAGLPFLAAMLALPMVPALLLGATAVWSMTAATSGRRDAGDD